MWKRTEEVGIISLLGIMHTGNLAGLCTIGLSFGSFHLCIDFLFSFTFVKASWNHPCCSVQSSEWKGA